MNKEEILDIFKKTDMLMEGHFLLTSGRHSDKYLQCAKVFQYPKISEMMSKIIADEFFLDHIDVVIGPAIGGIIFAYEVARQLGARALFAERENAVMTLRRGFELNQGENVLVVEDVTTTGGSVAEVINLAKRYGAVVKGVGALVDRSGGVVCGGDVSYGDVDKNIVTQNGGDVACGGDASCSGTDKSNRKNFDSSKNCHKLNFNVKFKSVISLNIKSYEKDECPLCRNNIPYIKPGSRDIK